MTTCYIWRTARYQIPKVLHLDNCFPRCEEPIEPSPHLHWPENANHITGQSTNLTLLIIWQHYQQLDSHNNQLTAHPTLHLESLVNTTGYSRVTTCLTLHSESLADTTSCTLSSELLMSKIERGSALCAKTTHLFQWHFLWECWWVLNPFSKLTLSLPTMHRPALNGLWN